MLAVRRKEGESVYLFVPDQTRIGVSVVRIEGDQVKLGFDASIQVGILRSELVEQELAKAGGIGGGNYPAMLRGEIPPSTQFLQNISTRYAKLQRE